MQGLRTTWGGIANGDIREFSVCTSGLPNIIGERTVLCTRIGLSCPSMIRICCSNRTETLLAAFVRNLQRERQSEGPFAPVRVVVPNRNQEPNVALIAERLTSLLDSAASALSTTAKAVGSK